MPRKPAPDDGRWTNRRGIMAAARIMNWGNPSRAKTPAERRALTYRGTRRAFLRYGDRLLAALAEMPQEFSTSDMSRAILITTRLMAGPADRLCSGFLAYCTATREGGIKRITKRVPDDPRRGVGRHVKRYRKIGVTGEIDRCAGCGQHATLKECRCLTLPSARTLTLLPTSQTIGVTEHALRFLPDGVLAEALRKRGYHVYPKARVQVLQHQHFMDVRMAGMPHFLEHTQRCVVNDIGRLLFDRKLVTFRSGTDVPVSGWPCGTKRIEATLVVVAPKPEEQKP